MCSFQSEVIGDGDGMGPDGAGAGHGGMGGSISNTNAGGMFYGPMTEPVAWGSSAKQGTDQVMLTVSLNAFQRKIN